MKVVLRKIDPYLFKRAVAIAHFENMGTEALFTMLLATYVETHDVNDALLTAAQQRWIELHGKSYHEQQEEELRK